MKLRLSETCLFSVLLLFGLMAISSGCTTALPNIQAQADHDYEHADADLELAENFNAEVRSCERRGGHMVLIMGNGGKIDRRTMELAYCETRSGVLYEGYGP